MIVRNETRTQKTNSRHSNSTIEMSQVEESLFSSSCCRNERRLDNKDVVINSAK